MGIVFFDLDGTLIKGLSSEKRFVLFLLQNRVIGLRQIIEFLAFSLKWIKRYRRDIWKKNKAYLTGLRKNDIQIISKEFASQVLFPSLRPDLKRHLENHLAMDDMVVLLTGAPDFLARPIAEKLGIPHIVATVCHSNKDTFTSAPPLIHPFGITKHKIAEQMCRNFNISIDQSMAYADSAGDIPLLSAVSRAVAVHPDRKLRKTAERLGWKIIY